ncbi:MAG: 30S ribosomal protein S6 [Puniceicoccales bacterium]|jgi:ribosomal protein S6|nr:30S ribosomal protein S6 [Puniceicoccales bacterium]
MAEEVKNNYKITVIFDTREQRESAADMLLRVKELMESLGASVISADNLGMKSFQRCAKRKFREGAYGSYSLSAKPSFGKALLERLRLDRTVNRTFVERV